MGKLRQRKEKKLCCDSSSGQGQSQGEYINKPLASFLQKGDTNLLPNWC